MVTFHVASKLGERLLAHEPEDNGPCDKQKHRLTFDGPTRPVAFAEKQNLWKRTSASGSLTLSASPPVHDQPELGFSHFRIKPKL